MGVASSNTSWRPSICTTWPQLQSGWSEGYNFWRSCQRIKRSKTEHTKVRKWLNKLYITIHQFTLIDRYLNDIHLLEIKEGTSLQWQCPNIEGVIPPVRESHSALAWDNKLVVYGGMNGRRLNDIWMLETDPWKWTNVTPQGPEPLPRSLHVSAIIKNKYVMYTGTCVHV